MASAGHQREAGLVSVVAPALDEEDLIGRFCARVVAALAGLGVPFELIVVDDGSSDETAMIVRDLSASDPRIRLVSLSRNFGHQAALTAGVDRAKGDAVVMMDADLQDPPELIGQMLERWRNGAEVIYAVRRARHGESRLKLATARWFYGLFSRLARVELEPNAGDFRLLDRRAVDVLATMRERNRFLRGMTSWVGFRQEAVHYDRDARSGGQSKFTLRSMVRFSIDAVSSFSNVPLQAATLLGFAFSLLAFLGIPVAIGFKLAGEFVPGITTVLLVTMMLGGIQLITVGIIGEYLGRVYEEVKQRPLYVVREDPDSDLADPATDPS